MIKSRYLRTNDMVHLFFTTKPPIKINIKMCLLDFRDKYLFKKKL